MTAQSILTDANGTTRSERSVSAPVRRRKGTGGGASVAIGVSLAVHAALAAYIVSTQFSLTTPEVEETAPVVVEMVPIESRRAPLKPVITPDIPKPETPVVEPKPMLQPRETPAPVVAQVAPLDMAPVKAPPVQAPVAAPFVAKPAPAAAQPRNEFVGVDVESALNSNPPPAYPPQAKARREEGTVQLRLQVRPDGSVGEVQVQASSGSMRLDRAAIDSVKRWKFRPATRGGQAVESWATVPITFGLRRGDRRRGHDHNSLASEQTSGDS
ncbi:MAG: energy transducer TonB [Asticcacaulis sp.]|uniref:energy transducer TonB n=1 Tax=Asticcacaulis sp. TaxID=1872648 RepID=UPI0025C2CE5A|nr:energy transducer TonB [Asticcacaulis sp.]MCA1935047.1 energy transducer TonB [Asticcacaulis sp.]